MITIVIAIITCILRIKTYKNRKKKYEELINDNVKSNCKTVV